MPIISFWVHWLTERARKSGKYRFTKFGWLTKRDPTEGAKITCKILFLSRRQALLKNQRALPNTENG